MNTQQKNKEGFTIIEVVLVLAIAGLIFLMVFIALPALQRGQRDSQRRNDLSRMQTAINNYQSNNRGALPSDWPGFKTSYLEAGGDTFIDPSGNNYALVAGGTTPPTVAGFESSSPRIYITTAAVCGANESLNTTNQGGRKVALQMRLEGGGIACVNN
jgi:prepilin-type N-terminal cleavage/methylation domain-containing protein